jgi:hypothetical protein
MKGPFMAINKKYKDSLFSFLFSDSEALRELYGAIEGKSQRKPCPKDTPSRRSGILPDLIPRQSPRFPKNNYMTGIKIGNGKKALRYAKTSATTTTNVSRPFFRPQNSARYPNPQTGLWLSTDPAMGEYVPQAPINDEAKKANGNLPGMGGGV